MTEMTVGESIPHLLADYGVRTVFGMPGVHSLELYRTLSEAGLHHVGVRHEQGAGFMADGFARASGQPGVAILISGPGLTNASTAIGQAYSDSVPMLVVTAAIDTENIGMGRGRLHEISDQQAMSAPLTGMSMLSHSPSQVQEQLAQAYSLFSAARPRPVHLGIPLNVLTEKLQRQPLVRARPAPPSPDPIAVKKIAELLNGAKCPIILAGGGATAAGEELRNLIDNTGSIFVSTVAGKGILSDDHPLSLGATLQRLPTRRLIADADLIIAIGTEIAEPDLYVTADAEASGAVEPELLEPQLTVRGRVVRIDIDHQVLARGPAATIAVTSDARRAVAALNAAIGEQCVKRRLEVVVSRTRNENTNALSQLESAHHRVLMAIREALPADGMVYADMTQIAYTGCITFPVYGPRQWHFPMGFGTLGYALPAAIGGKIACPGRAVVALAGDGGFQFTLPELATAVEEKVSIAIILWDNESLGEIESFMKARQVPEISVRPKNPDFSAIATAYGCSYARARTLDQIKDAIGGAIAESGPTIIHLKQSDFDV